jgi:cytochrome c-type biogenesis protein CcmH/NrfG
MTRKRSALGGLVAVVLAAGLLLGGLMTESDSARTAARPSLSTAGAQLLGGFSPGDTAGYVRDLEVRIAADGDDAETLALLGLAYQQRARETGNPSYYPRSSEALRRALALDPNVALAKTGLAALSASRHRFREARDLAREAVRLDPDGAAAYGILGDALVELGRYDGAFAAFDRMTALKPSLSSYARVAYGRELVGHTDAAVDAMLFAVEAGSGVPEHAAWTLVQLGNLYVNSGRLRLAEQSYSEALARDHGYVHAWAGLARVLAARGRLDTAADRYWDVVETVPLPEYAIALVDVLAAAGRDAEAREATELVDALERLFRANGVRTELETALFDLDHGRDVADALSRARKAYGAAPSIHAEDVLAWGLFKNGRCAEARARSIHALRLGTRDALMHFHRGMIESCSGDRPAGRAFLARALALNPHFSLLHAPTAREALR